jgi:putative ABC transport system ATP-binding protein
MALLEDLHRDGATIVMVTHDPQLAARAQRNVHVVDGQVVDMSEEIRLTSPRGAAAAAVA